MVLSVPEREMELDSLGCSQNLETGATQAKTYEAEMGS